ncbi:sensor histidine kinase [Herbiconiux ginsengi]|uniref:sensor histidine kinase n=1 Tax=Herbiconiux ginsengi TaxID=381665 RepID=UPI0015879D98|nr:ATP-binding protein [Herbiconiux ginsengi]
MPGRISVAPQTDREFTETERTTLDVGVQRRARLRVAEDTRLLHDTAINTLLAIANGVAGTISTDEIRQQCARDVALLRALTERSADGLDARASLHEVFGFLSLPIRRTGLDDEHLDRVTGQLSPATVRALVACAREAITNAAKHSGSNDVEVGYHHEGGQLSLIVKDDGIGFDRATATGYGLANSIFARAADHAITVDLRTAPREGTAIVLRVPIAPSDAAVVLGSGDPLVWRASAATVGAVIVAVVAGLGRIWTRILNTDSRRGRQSALPRQRRSVARVTYRQADAQPSHARWREAGLDAAIRLLADIADGHLDPRSASVRDACRREEMYLRQLARISPELLNLGRAVVAALSETRTRDVSLSVNLGALDTPNPAVAIEIGRAILMAVRNSPRRSSLVVTVFPVRDGMQLTVIGPRPSTDPLSGFTQSPHVVDCSRRRLSGTATLAQIIFRSTSERLDDSVR